ncbi:MAG TPA: hypothetical protein VLU25_03745 [Acidobacteriota bacterium]|nr:hypothetical protein [Acidobacteriota bacterium]
MKSIFFLATSLVFASVCWAQKTPIKFDLSAAGLEDRAPIFRAFDAAEDSLEDATPLSTSPSRTRTLVLLEESDLTEVPYDKSLAKAVILEKDTPVATVLVRGYRGYSFAWINEDLLHLYGSPGRCVTLDWIYDVSSRNVLYHAAYQHCGVRK